MTSVTTFFSYSRKDSVFVLKLAKDLRNAGAELWIDQLDIKAGSPWDASIEAALISASRIIIFLSPASVVSNHVLDEISLALDEGKTVIPALLSECKTPMRLRRLQRIDFTRDYQTGLNQLLEILEHTATSNVKTESTKKTKIIDSSQQKTSDSIIVGDHYLGGIIFHILKPGDKGYDSKVKHGLIAAPKDQGKANWAEAIKMCADLKLKGYSDWYLPNKDELEKLFQNKERVSGFVNDYYWSSTETDVGSAARTQDFYSGYQINITKNALVYARAVRAF